MYKIQKRFNQFSLYAMLLVVAMPYLCSIILGYCPTSISALYDTICVGLFVAMLSVAGVLFINQSKLDRTRPYNLYFGLALILVPLFPHKSNYTVLDIHLLSILHFVFAGFFYLGHAFVILRFSAARELFWKIPLVIFGILLPISTGVLAPHMLSLFWAENIANKAIMGHYWLEINDKTT